jgi:type II secretory pathway component PulJ
MKTKTKFQKGLTLIELMIAAMAAAIVILASSMVIVSGQNSWSRAWKDVTLQRDASYAMLVMARSIQSATDANFSADGRTLYIPKQSDPNVITFSYMADTNNLQLQAGGATQNLVIGEVNNLQFSYDTAGSSTKNAVKIDLSLKKDYSQAHFISTVMMRNYGG